MIPVLWHSKKGNAMQTVKRSVADRTEGGRGEQWSTEGAWGEATLYGDSRCMPC